MGGLLSPLDTPLTPSIDCLMSKAVFMFKFASLAVIVKVKDHLGIKSNELRCSLHIWWDEILDWLLCYSLFCIQLREDYNLLQQNTDGTCWHDRSHEGVSQKCLESKLGSFNRTYTFTKVDFTFPINQFLSTYLSKRLELSAFIKF